MTQIARTLFIALLACCLVSPAFAAGPDPDRFIVGFSNSDGRAAATATGEVLLDLPQINAAAMRLNATAAAALANNPNIAYVEVDAPRYPMAQSTPWGITAVQADLLSDGPGNVTVCVIDSGYDLGHEDLPNASGYNGNLPWAQDGFGHGTHVAGTIAAVDNTVGVVGVADPNLYIVRVFGNDGAWAYSSSLVDAAYRCEAGGANIISMSLGGSFSSGAEDTAFADLNDNYGILSIAAAGNDGNKRKSYPASYASVVSVAAVDSALNIADFSQQNNAVELAAPGVTVRSTVPMGTGTDESTTVDGTGYEVTGMDFSGQGTGTGTLVDCGIAGAGTTGFACAGVNGAVCLIQRGDFSFEDKTAACANGGGVAAIIYNNIPGLFSGTLGNQGSIPSVGMSDTDGLFLLNNKLGTTASVTVNAGNYAFYQGTSMATPHVSGVAALVWSQDTSVSNQCVRDAMVATAIDLGTAGYDNAYGNGLVQALDAANWIAAGNCGGGGGCTPTENPEVSCTDGVDNDCDGATDGADSDCGGACEPAGVACNDASVNCCNGCSGGKPGTRVCL